MKILCNSSTRIYKFHPYSISPGISPDNSLNFLNPSNISSPLNRRRCLERVRLPNVINFNFLPLMSDALPIFFNRMHRNHFVENIPSVKVSNRLDIFRMYELSFAFLDILSIPLRLYIYIYIYYSIYCCLPTRDDYSGIIFNGFSEQKQFSKAKVTVHVSTSTPVYTYN